MFQDKNSFFDSAYHGVLSAYCLAMMSYLSGESYRKQEPDSKNNIQDEKAALTMLGYAISYSFVKIMTNCATHAFNRKMLKFSGITIDIIALVFLIILTNAERVFLYIS